MSDTSTSDTLGHGLRHLAALVVGIAPAFAACTLVGPDFEVPDAPVAASWIESDDPRLEAGRIDDREWWRVFNDPILDELIDAAHRQNLDLRAAGVRVLQARANLGIAIGGFYPQQQQAVGEAQYNRQSVALPYSLPLPSSKLSYWQVSLGTQLSWELDFWGRLRRAIESADASFLAAVAAYDNALVTLVSDVATSYIGIRTLEQQLAIAYSNVDVQRQALKIAQLRFRGGTTTDRDVAQAETVLASTEATIPTLQTQIQQGKNALSVLLGLPPGAVDEKLKRGKGIPKAPIDVAVGIPADLLRRRPDIRQAELLAAAQSAQIGVAKAELYPAFSLTGNFGHLASNTGDLRLGDLFSRNGISAAFGPTLQWNILNYGQITNNVRLQDARLQERLVAYQTTVLRAQREVEDGLVAFLQSQERLKSLKQAADAAKRSLDLATIQYREGTADFTTVLNALQDLLAQQNNLAIELGQAPTSLVGIYRALGGGWQLREGRDFVPRETREQMAKRTNWGDLLTPVDLLRPQAPGLPSAEDVSARPRPPEW